MNATSTRVAICTLATLALAGCATTQGRPQQNALDRSINQCVGAVVIGALLGTAIASKNRGKGALIGAGVGTVACGVLIAINNAQDKQRVREAQVVALNSGGQRTEQFVGQDGQPRVVQTSVSEVSTPPARAIATTSTSSPDAFVGPCRNAQTAITVQGQTAQLPPELYCRTAGGDWKLYGV